LVFPPRVPTLCHKFERVIKECNDVTSVGEYSVPEGHHREVESFQFQEIKAMG